MDNDAHGEERESERKTCERGFMSVCSPVILIMAPDSRVQYSEARAGRQQTAAKYSQYQKSI